MLFSNFQKCVLQIFCTLHWLDNCKTKTIKNFKISRKNKRKSAFLFKHRKNGGNKATNLKTVSSRARIQRSLSSESWAWKWNVFPSTVIVNVASSCKYKYKIQISSWMIHFGLVVLLLSISTLIFHPLNNEFGNILSHCFDMRLKRPWIERKINLVGVMKKQYWKAFHFYELRKIWP